MQGKYVAKGTRVLLLESKRKSAIAITGILERCEGIRMAGCIRDADELVAAVKELVPDVVMIDADRPGRDLVGLCSRLRASYPVGIVLFSTESRRGPVSEGLAAGAHLIVSWPFNPRDLIIAVLDAALLVESAANVAVLPSIEGEIRADKTLTTGRLRPMLCWISEACNERISPRLTRLAAPLQADCKSSALGM